MSSASSSGSSSRICCEVFPAASCFSTTETGIRSPRTQGWPPQTRGSTVSLVKGDILLAYPDDDGRTIRDLAAASRPLFGEASSAGRLPS